MVNKCITPHKVPTVNVTLDKGVAVVTTAKKLFVGFTLQAKYVYQFIAPLHVFQLASVFLLVK